MSTPRHAARMAPPDSELVTLPPPPGALAPSVEIPVRWRASLRAKNVSLRICPSDGVVIVTLPPRRGRRAGLALIQEHEIWVVERLAALTPLLGFEPGARFERGHGICTFSMRPRIVATRASM